MIRKTKNEIIIKLSKIFRDIILSFLKGISKYFQDKKDIKNQLKFLSNNGASNLEHFFDKEMKIFKALKLRGIPTTIIVNQNSFIISKHEGILKWGEDAIINKIKSLFY